MISRTGHHAIQIGLSMDLKTSNIVKQLKVANRYKVAYIDFMICKTALYALMIDYIWK